MDNSVKQYIDLYSEHAEKFSTRISTMDEPRATALEYLRHHGLPSFRSEDYQRTDVNALLAKDWGINLNRIQFAMRDVCGFSCDLPDTACGVHAVVNDAYRSDLGHHDELPNGAFAGGLLEFARKFPEIFARHYAQIASSDKNGLVALNTLMAQDGFVLYVPSRVQLPHPVQLVQLLRSTEPLMAFRRILVIMEEGSSAKMLVCEHTLDNIEFLSLQVFEIHVAAGAQFELIDMEESSTQTARISSLHLEQKADSHVTLNGLTINNGLTRNNYYCRMTEPHAELTLGGLAIGTDSQHIDNYTWVEHATTDCRTNELFKYVLTGTSYGVFSGRILVDRGAQKTTAYQSNRNLLLSDNAKMYSKPQLEIYADDVKCSHGMTTGQLDDDALFYLQQRGIPREEAITMLSIAFTEEVVRIGHIEGLKERLEHIIEARFRGETLHCSRCGASKF